MKQKVFLAYRFTGEDPARLKALIPRPHDALEEAGHDHYPTINDNE
jgi:hypothetical protein